VDGKARQEAKQDKGQAREGKAGKTQGVVGLSEEAEGPAPQARAEEEGGAARGGQEGPPGGAAVRAGADSSARSGDCAAHAPHLGVSDGIVRSAVNPGWRVAPTSVRAPIDENRAFPEQNVLVPGLRTSVIIVASHSSEGVI
jgi:hypothetical protein